ncbi:zinc finger protein 235 isoform X2 [Lingula anatina]|uniref:Zinc finger protein 235 isoform X1 n=1 Tax=Lingula anatina TaxID=7574 RepID=A0A1S3JHA8_LINAN|nr:zinc finger protein 235 isoform X1 [Lingula anatina]XP_013409795.1 zinc finger protein 235 isoform X2 [Lingula anatina]|eukprot:XP_013409794.1 zinc finger protein 235 isoform X1 [Lingula anatina]
MVHKHCAYGTCKSDSRHADKSYMAGVFFLPFPKQKTNFEKCKRWVHLCGRPMEQFNMDKISKYTYMCSKHFVGGNGPTEEYPDPISALACPEQVSKINRRQRKGPKQRTAKRHEKKSVKCSRYKTVREVCQTEKMDDVATDDQDTAEFLNAPHCEAEAAVTCHSERSAEITKIEEKEKCFQVIDSSSQFELDKEGTPSQEKVIRPLEQFLESGIGINIGQQLPRWNALKDRLQLETNESLAKHLMDYYCKGGTNILHPVITDTKGVHSLTHYNYNSQSKLYARRQQETEQDTFISETVTDTGRQQDSDHSNSIVQADSGNTREQDSVHSNSIIHAVSDTKREQYSDHSNTLTQVVSETKGQQEASANTQIIPKTKTDQNASIKQVDSSGVKVAGKKYLVILTNSKHPNPTCLLIPVQKRELMLNKDVDSKSPHVVSTQPNVIHSEIPTKTAANKMTITSSVSSNTVLTSSLGSTHRGHLLSDQENALVVGTIASEPHITVKNKIATKHTYEEPEKMSSDISILKAKKSNIKIKKEMDQKEHGNGSFICETCGKSFGSFVRLRLHNIMHKDVSEIYRCKMCNCLVYEKEREAHEWTHTKPREPKVYICQYCGQDFPTMYRITLHERSHLGEKPHVCKICGKTFAKRGSLVLHEMTHTGERPHKCRFCERSFVQKTAAVNHERVHTGERPFKCRFCRKGFTQSGTRNSHERIHTNVRTFNCHSCWKVFAYEKDLKRHEAIHKS